MVKIIRGILIFKHIYYKMRVGTIEIFSARYLSIRIGFYQGRIVGFVSSTLATFLSKYYNRITKSRAALIGGICGALTGACAGAIVYCGVERSLSALWGVPSVTFKKGTGWLAIVSNILNCIVIGKLCVHPALLSGRMGGAQGGSKAYDWLIQQEVI